VDPEACGFGIIFTMAIDMEKADVARGRQRSVSVRCWKFDVVHRGRIRGGGVVSLELGEKLFAWPSRTDRAVRTDAGAWLKVVESVAACTGEKE
jgi:hypothetical protein